MGPPSGRLRREPEIQPETHGGTESASRGFDPSGIGTPASLVCRAELIASHQPRLR
jgi:hypothetical protein